MEAIANQRDFPDQRNFVTWEWNDKSTIGPYANLLDWWARTTLTWVEEKLAEATFPRDDYRELVELICIVLGGQVCRMTDGMQ